MHESAQFLFLQTNRASDIRPPKWHMPCVALICYDKVMYSRRAVFILSGTRLLFGRASLVGLGIFPRMAASMLKVRAVG